MKTSVHRFKSTPTLKMLIIGMIMIILLIPASMVESIIYERQALRHSTIQEVSSKWANEQLIDGPILTIPYTKEYTVDDEIRYSNHHLHILPKQLSVDGNIDTKELSRGIYDVIVYESNLDVQGEFSLDAVEQLRDAHEIIYEHSFLTIGMSDLRGIQSEIKVTWSETTYDVEPGSKIANQISSGVTVKPTIRKGVTSYNFEYSLLLNGSSNLSFIPVGGTTDVHLSSTWHSPSFNGHILPDEREVSDEGFTANWKVLELNRDFPSHWTSSDNIPSRNTSSFGVDLIIPVDDYQRSTRSAKYAILVIVTTFLVFFLVEILYKKRVHPFQYTLVGLALCLFYILLISISEHSSFDFAYGISALAVVAMIGLYSTSVFKSFRHSALLVAVLLALYGFLYVTLRLVDYALLMGAGGLALMLAATMYFTRKVDWYGLTDKVAIART